MNSGQLRLENVIFDVFEQLKRNTCWKRPKIRTFMFYLNTCLTMIEEVEQMPQMTALDPGNENNSGAVRMDSLAEDGAH